MSGSDFPLPEVNRLLQMHFSFDSLRRTRRTTMRKRVGAWLDRHDFPRLADWYEHRFDPKGYPPKSYEYIKRLWEHQDSLRLAIDFDSLKEPLADIVKRANQDRAKDYFGANSPRLPLHCSFVLITAIERSPECELLYHGLLSYGVRPKKTFGADRLLLAAMPQDFR